MTYGKEQSAGKGTFTMNTTGVKNINFTAVDVPADVTITALKDKDGNAVSLSDYLLAPASATGVTYIRANDIHEYFTHITTTAGACTLVLK